MASKSDSHSDSTELPGCGIYRTTEAIGDIPAGQFVYFHNHGDPGPGIYLPDGWECNRAQFSGQGHTLEDVQQADSLEPLLEEGLYRVTEEFTCCEKKCRTYPIDLLVQLGYDGDAQALLFVPEWAPSGLAIPEYGQPLDDDRLAKLSPLTVPDQEADAKGELAPAEETEDSDLLATETEQ